MPGLQDTFVFLEPHVQNVATSPQAEADVTQRPVQTAVIENAPTTVALPISDAEYHFT